MAHLLVVENETRASARALANGSKYLFLIWRRAISSESLIGLRDSIGSQHPLLDLARSARSFSLLD